MVCGIWYLEAQGSYSQAIAVAINHLSGITSSRVGKDIFGI